MSADILHKKTGQKQLDKYKFTLYSISGLIYKGKQW